MSIMIAIPFRVVLLHNYGKRIMTGSGKMGTGTVLESGNTIIVQFQCGKEPMTNTHKDIVILAHLTREISPGVGCHSAKEKKYSLKNDIIIISTPLAAIKRRRHARICLCTARQSKKN